MNYSSSLMSLLLKNTFASTELEHFRGGPILRSHLVLPHTRPQCCTTYLRHVVQCSRVLQIPNLAPRSPIKCQHLVPKRTASCKGTSVRSRNIIPYIELYVNPSYAPDAPQSWCYEYFVLHMSSFVNLKMSNNPFKPKSGFRNFRCTQACAKQERDKSKQN